MIEQPGGRESDRHEHNHEDQAQHVDLPRTTAAKAALASRDQEDVHRHDATGILGLSLIHI